MVAETDPVPFVEAFVNEGLGKDLREVIVKAIMEVKEDVELCRILETKNGFVEPPNKK